ncbi:hypothetical protein AVEN_9110-1 [Araneus ventricosus]|uniref:Uncharacterized protein n=1 Tax=Araneus ventricosus TaxID=182803 RepID=A0A4Y2PE43_ARAVE|nr:hypothetical protein AVEN_9110-1 [Araneus ventricosus]
MDNQSRWNSNSAVCLRQFPSGFHMDEKFCLPVFQKLWSGTAVNVPLNGLHTHTDVLLLASKNPISFLWPSIPMDNQSRWNSNSAVYATFHRDFTWTKSFAFRCSKNCGVEQR